MKWNKKYQSKGIFIEKRKRESSEQQEVFDLLEMELRELNKLFATEK